MRLSRRDLFRLLTVSVSGAALLQATERLAAAVASQPNPPILLWLNDGGDDLSLLPLLGQQVPGFLELVTQQWNVQALDAVLPLRGAAEGQDVGGAPILVVERMPPLAALDGPADSPLLTRLASAKAAILLGTDACYGGFTGDPAAVARFGKLCRQLKTPLIRLPGVPPPPHHLVGVLAHLEFFGFPSLDAHGRPVLYYGRTVCVTCERRVDLDEGRFAPAYGQGGCLLKLGCKGLITHNTCSTARWNNGENWCVGAGGPCTGCSEPGYPDHGGVGLYGRLIGGAEGVRPVLWGAVENIGYGMLGLAGLGLGLQALRRWLLPALEAREAPRRPEER
jgi:NiFe/NiFeSe hydrogenase small subunit C-terminal